MRLLLKLGAVLLLALGTSTGHAQDTTESSSPPEPPAVQQLPPAAAPDEPQLAPPPASQAVAPTTLPEPPRARPLPLAVRGRPPSPPPPRLRAEQPRRHGDAGAPLALGIGGFVKWRHDPGYAHVAENEGRQRGFELSATYDVLQPVPRLVLAAGVSYRHVGGSSGDQLDYAEHELTADASLRYPLLSWLTPHVRAGAGLVSTRVELTDPSADLVLSDSDQAFLGSLGAGVTVHTPSRAFETRRGRMASLIFGVLIEGGGTFAPAASFHAPRGQHAGLEQAELGLGSLARTAPYLRVSGVVRF